MRRRATEDALPALRAAVATLDDPDDDAAIARLISESLGLAADVISSHGARGADERDVDLRDPQRPERAVRLRFPSKYEVPGDADLLVLLAPVSERVAALRTSRERRADRTRERRTGALARDLVGVTDVEAIARLLERHVVPRVAAGCAIVFEGDEPTSADVRVPPVGFPAVALVGLADDAPATHELARELAELAVRSVCSSLSSLDEQFALAVLERSLLPQAIVPVPGLELASRYRPAGGSSRLAGGDFYDVVRRDDEVVIIVGDVQGKGVEAAALTSVARHTLRAGAIRGIEPAAMLTVLNDVLLYAAEEARLAGEQPAPRFLTAVVVLLRPAAHGFDVTIARAGHEPPVIVRRDGSAELLQPDGALLGVLDELHLEEAESVLRLGDTLVLYTDGVTEQRDSDEQFDEQALAQLLRGRSDVVGADAIAQLILDTVLLVTRSHQRDDIALVVARPV